MSPAVELIPPIPISDHNLPIALRPMVDFLPMRGSIFDDPGDEKSWHVSQRSEGLSEYYAEREPSWYASAVAPLKDAERVLDIGCGPGLALQALLDQGCSSVLGIDRWPAFAASSTPAAPILVHDLSLPMPFLDSGAFDGVLSHYALDYVSPICARQILREAHRVLSPGGQLVVYVAAIGLGGGDVARTVAYSPKLLETLLGEVGFEEMQVELSPDGRNAIAKSRRSATLDDAGRPVDGGVFRASIDGDTQLAASFTQDIGSLKLEACGVGPKLTLAFDLDNEWRSGNSPLSVCAWVQSAGSGDSELQVWAWSGYRPVLGERVRFEFPLAELRINFSGRIRHGSVWRPTPIPVEPIGNAYARAADLPDAAELSEIERGSEGRQVVVESAADDFADVGDWLGLARNRLRIVRGSTAEVSVLDEEWLCGHAHGVVVSAQDLTGRRLRELLLWAGWRQSLIYLEGGDWLSVLAAASRREAELHGPVVLVDPALCGTESSGSLPTEVASFVAEHSRFFVLLAADSRRQLTLGDLERLENRLLLGGSPSAGTESQEANENLRYLAERTILMRLRQAYRHSPSEVGRREPRP
jgi:SAM-dependent methyltransferase